MSNPTEQELMTFEGLVNKISRRAIINCIVGYEDIRQELFTKIFVKWDYISQEEDPGKRMSLVSTILNNHVRSVIAFYSRRPDTSVFANESSFSEEGESSNILDGSPNSGTISNGSNFVSPEDSFFGSELLEKVVRFAEEEGGDIQRYIEEIISPSEESEALFEEMKKKSAVYRSCRQIPPQTIAKTIMGKDSHFHYMVLNKLKIKLVEWGYTNFWCDKKLGVGC